VQEYELDAGSKLAGIVGTTRARGKSYHHQANASIGSNLKAVAISADGIVEAVEDVGLPWFIGVQWHPERTPDDATTVRLFKSLVDAALEYRQRRRA
jgi:putative glutamine amidotransferase